MSVTREPLEWHFKQLDHAVGLSFKSNFHFALVGHLIKGYRHPTPTTVSRTSRVLTMLLGIVAKPMQRDKFEVSTDSVAYLTGTSKFNTHPFPNQYKHFIPCCLCSAGGRIRGSSFKVSCEAYVTSLAGRNQHKQ